MWLTKCWGGGVGQLFHLILGTAGKVSVCCQCSQTRKGGRPRETEAVTEKHEGALVDLTHYVLRTCIRA